jgi:DNA repair protein RadC
MERPKGHPPSKYQLAFDYGYRPAEVAVADGMRFTYEVKEAVKVLSPVDAGRYLLTRVFTPFEAFEQEEVWLLLLNNRQWITHQSMIYRGTINMVNMRIGEIFKPALRYNASSIVVSHVHPSGEIEPSPEDIAVTQALYTAGKLLDVRLLDHLIIGRDCWLSLKTQGLGFEDPQ